MQHLIGIRIVSDSMQIASIQTVSRWYPDDDVEYPTEYPASIWALSGYSLDTFVNWIPAEPNIQNKKKVFPMF